MHKANHCSIENRGIIVQNNLTNSQREVVAGVGNEAIKYRLSCSSLLLFSQSQVVFHLRVSLIAGVPKSLVDTERGRKLREVGPEAFDSGSTITTHLSSYITLSGFIRLCLA